MSSFKAAVVTEVEGLTLYLKFEILGFQFCHAVYEFIKNIKTIHDCGMG